MQMKGEGYGRKHNHRIGIQSSFPGNGDRQCGAGIFPKRGRRQDPNHSSGDWIDCTGTSCFAVARFITTYR